MDAAPAAGSTETMTTDARDSSRGMRIVARIAVGAVCGLAWAAGLRAYMAEINGFASHVDVAGTFIGVLLPGALVGSIIAWSTALDPTRRGRRIALRWCAIGVLALAVFPMLLPGALWLLLTTGIGGGAVFLALGGLAGGYALGGRRLWARVVCGIPALVVVAAMAATVPLIGGRDLAASTGRGLWVIVLATSLTVVLMIAASIPFRRLRSALTV